MNSIQQLSGRYLATAALMCVMVVPFLMNVRVGPQTGFIIESTAAILALLLVLGVGLMGKFRHQPPVISLMFIGFAAFIMLQARWMHLSWYTQVDLTAAVLVVVALATWALSSWQQDQESSLMVWVAWALVLGAVLQTMIMWLQYLNLTAFSQGILSYSSSTNIMGQLGQRNHLGHYLMWGMVSVLYLKHSKAISNWFAAALVIWMGIGMGLVGSRTLIVYMLAIAVLAVFWRWRNGKTWQPTLLWVLATMVWVLIVQLGFAQLVDAMGWPDIRTGVGRLARSGMNAVDAGRTVEWQKAWLSFESAPLLGHGWGSFSSQSFYLHGQKEQFLGHVLVPVLYTHSHNGVLQLLSEVGLVGTLWIGLCLLYLVWQCVRHAKHPASFFILSMVTVSLCHSMLEYPLWYVYFLIPFALFWALVPTKQHFDYETFIAPKTNRVLTWLAVIAIGINAYMLVMYNQVMSVYGVAKNETPAIAAEKKAKIHQLLKKTYFLNYYAQMALFERSFDAYQGQEEADEVENARLVAEYRPYSTYATRWGLYLYRSGQHDAGEKWMEYTWRYYPTTINGNISAMQKSVWFGALVPVATERCLQYKQKIKITCPSS